MNNFEFKCECGKSNFHFKKLYLQYSKLCEKKKEKIFKLECEKEVLLGKLETLKCLKTTVQKLLRRTKRKWILFRERFWSEAEVGCSRGRIIFFKHVFREIEKMRKNYEEIRKCVSEIQRDYRTAKKVFEKIIEKDIVPFESFLNGVLHFVLVFSIACNIIIWLMWKLIFGFPTQETKN